MLEHFREHGWVRIPGAFSSQEAAAMCDVVWAELSKAGILRNDTSTWTTARPEHLQHLKTDPAFRAIGSDCTLQAIDAVMDGQPWQRPRDWGAFFLQFPTGQEWNIPNQGWHIDGNYAGSLWPPCGIKVHAMLTEVAPRCGGVNILSGSHRLIHQWFQRNPLPPKTRGTQYRKSLERHRYLRDLTRTDLTRTDLTTADDSATRIARFHERAEVVDGVPLQVVENTASPGDVILMHSLLLHAGAPAAHLGAHPRFLLNQDIHQPY
jgi:hypothetical protein